MAAIKLKNDMYVFAGLKFEICGVSDQKRARDPEKVSPRGPCPTVAAPVGRVSGLVFSLYSSLISSHGVAPDNIFFFFSFLFLSSSASSFLLL